MTNNKELMIGNYINNSELGIGIVVSIDFESVELDTETNKEFTEKALLCESFGIPLTEEWLVNFGFSENKNFIAGLWLELQDCGSLSMQFTENKLNLWTTSGVHKIYNDITVHQLQNLYFALTGEELTIK